MPVPKEEVPAHEQLPTTPPAPVNHPVVDIRGVRASALVTTCVCGAAAIITLVASERTIAGIVLLGLQVLAFVIGAYRLRWHPWGRLARLLKLPRLFPKGEPEHAFPVVFSQKVGLIIIAPALILLIFDEWVASVVLMFGAVLAGSLNAFFNICLACKIYPFVACYFSTR